MRTGLFITVLGLSLSAASQSVSLFAAGDVMLARGVAGVVAQRGADYPFAAMRDRIRSADIAFANLECALTPGPPDRRREMVFRADPADAAAIARAGFTVLSLANNHSPNFGPAGLQATFQALSGANIRYVGAGPDADGAAAPVWMEVRGVRIAFLAYNDPAVVPPAYAAAARRAGTNFMDVARMRAAVAAVRARAGLVIVSMHAGTEYSAQPDRRQVDFARAAIDAGADAVIGHHPHVVQPEEIWHGRPIFYSLGNFVFDQNWSQATEEGLAVILRWQKDGAWKLASVDMVPVRIEHGQPRPAPALEAQQILARVHASRAPGSP